MVSIAPQDARPPNPRGLGYANDALLVSQGIPGLKAWFGRLYDDVDQSLLNERGRLLIRQMLDNDATVGAMLNGLEFTLRGVTVSSTSADDTPEAKRQEEFILQCKDDMESSFVDMMCESMRGSLGFGWDYREVLYKRRLGPEPPELTPTYTDPDPWLPPSNFDDGTFGWHKFDIRSQESLWRWEFSPSFRLLGMRQLPPPDYIERFIDYRKSLLFRPSQYKDSPEGHSLLRNAVPFWRRKRDFEALEGIGAERDLAGIPVAGVPPELLSPNATDDQKALLAVIEKLVRNIRRDEQEGVVMPLAYDTAGHLLYELKLLSAAGQRQFDIDRIIQRYDQRIAMTMFADFLLLGHESGSTGTAGQVRTRTNLWVMPFNALLASFFEVVNRRAIPMLIKANGWDVTKAPKLKFSDVKSLSVQELGVLLQVMSQAGFPVGEDRNVYDHMLAEAAIPSDTAAVAYEAQKQALQEVADAQIKRQLRGNLLAQNLPPAGSTAPRGQRSGGQPVATRADTKQDRGD